MTRLSRICWLHIGAPKTGSTALQMFLAANSERLDRSGYTYPSAARRAGGHHDLAFLLNGGYPEWAVPQEKTLGQLTADLRKEIDEGHPTIVLSSENFYLLCEPAAVLDLMGQLGFSRESIRVVVYLRRQDEAILSWYNQAVKAQGYQGTLDEHLAATRDLWDYSRQLQAWADTFGGNRLIVRRYSPDSDIRRDFIAALGLPEGGFDFPAERINTEINRDILEFQRQLNRLPLTTRQKRHFHKQLIALTAATSDLDIFSTAPLLDDEQRQRLLETYAMGNRQVAGDYFGGGELFSPVATGARPSSGPAPGLTPEKLAAVLGWLIISRECQFDKEVKQ